MAEEIDNDLGNDSPLEGADEIYSGIDEVLGMESGGGAEQQGGRPAEQQRSDQQPQEGDGDDLLGELSSGEEKPRGEDGKFVAKETKGQGTGSKEQGKEQQQAAGEDKDKDKDKEKEKEKGAATDKQYPETIKSPKARHEFDTLRQQRDDAYRKAEGAELRLRNLEKQFTDLQSKSGTAAPEVKVLQQKIEGLEKDRDELERIVSFKAVEETKAFREGVSKPQEEAMDVLRQVAETYSLDAGNLDAVLGVANRFKRLEMLGDLTEGLPERASFVKAELQQAVDKWVGAAAKEDELRANAKGNREYAEQERQQSEATGALERQKAFRAAEKEVLTQLGEKLPELSGAEDVWKEIMEKSGKVADFDKMPAKAKAFANVASYAVKPLITLLRAAKAELASTKEALAARAKALPGAGGGRESSTREEGAGDGKSFFEVLDEQL